MRKSSICHCYGYNGNRSFRSYSRSDLGSFRSYSLSVRSFWPESFRPDFYCIKKFFLASLA